MPIASPAKPQAFKDCNDCPEMVVIPAGIFMAGSSEADSDRAQVPKELAFRQQLLIKVTIAQNFAISRFEVTRGQFSIFASENEWQPDGSCAVLEDGPANRWTPRADRHWLNPGFEQTDAHPVVCVNVKDVLAYANWLSKKTGHRYRLPSGTEWEYAARGGTSAARPWDNQITTACDYANGSDVSRAKAHNRGEADPARFFPCDDGYVYTAPVGSFRANAFGLHDMLGNVLEWTSDCLNISQTNAPTDGRARITGDCNSQINRGGAWNNSPKYVLFATQHADVVGARNSVLGFRVVREMVASETVNVNAVSH